MNGVLIVAHGSRAKNTLDTFESIVGMVRERKPQTLIELAYMEFCEETIEVGLLKLAAQGATKIQVAPYFLFQGVHIQEDIPQEIAKFLKDHPQLTITMGNTLGADPRLADILADRITG